MTSLTQRFALVVFHDVEFARESKTRGRLFQPSRDGFKNTTAPPALGSQPPFNYEVAR
jgi:hypothetical protein